MKVKIAIVVFWICSFWKVKYFFLAPIGWKLNNYYAFFPIDTKDWDVAVWAVRFFLWDHSLMKRKGRCRLPMNLSQTDKGSMQGFQRTGRPAGRPIVPLSRDKNISLSRCPFVPGQKYFLVPLSLCPGTRAGAKIMGQTTLSLDPRTKSFSQKKPKNRKRTF